MLKRVTNKKQRSKGLFTRNSGIHVRYHPTVYRVVPRVVALVVDCPGHLFQTLADCPVDHLLELPLRNWKLNARKRGYWRTRACQRTGLNHKSYPIAGRDFDLVSSLQLTFVDHIVHNCPAGKKGNQNIKF